MPEKKDKTAGSWDGPDVHSKTVSRIHGASSQPDSKTKEGSKQSPHTFYCLLPFFCCLFMGFSTLQVRSAFILSLH